MDFDDLVLKATEPYRNGCSWRLILTGPYATTALQRLEYGCYFGPYAMASDAGALQADLTERSDWDGRGCTVKLKPETVEAAMKRECPCCHAPLFVTPNGEVSGPRKGD